MSKTVTSGTATDVTGKVDRIVIEEIGASYTLKSVKDKVDEIVRAMKPVASCLAAMMACVGTTARAETNVLENIPANSTVVVSEDDPVAMSVIPGVVAEATNEVMKAATNYVDREVAGMREEVASKIAEKMEAATNYTDAATNALAAAIPVIDMEPYATKAWVGGRGYLTDADVSDMATRTWVGAQGFLVASALNGYATQGWLQGLGYVTKGVTNGLASVDWVNGRGYATQSWVNEKGYVTKGVTNGLASMAWVEGNDYASKAWVNGNGYVTKSVTNGLASKTWVTGQDYATETWVTNRKYVTKSVTNGLASKTWVEAKGYATIGTVERDFATKEELMGLERRYADTNGVTRIWSDDGLSMTDGTGVVWRVTWNAVTNWVSLTNGITYRPVVRDGVMRWEGDGIVTNKMGIAGMGIVANASGGVYWEFYVSGDTIDDAFYEQNGLFLSELYENQSMRPDAFTGRVERVASYLPVARVVTNAVGYVTGGGGGAVESVNGKTGAVELVSADVGAQPALDAAQTDAVNSGVTSNKVEAWEALAAGGPYLPLHGIADYSVSIYNANAAGGTRVSVDNEANLKIYRYDGEHVFALKDDVADATQYMKGVKFDFSDNRVLYVALSNIITAAGGIVTNFPSFQQ